MIGRLRAALGARYELVRELGEGGMATVYLAQDLKHQRLVALKVVLPELAQALGVERFLREIEVAARLQHPHVLGLYDSGSIEDGGVTLPFYTMPFVEGESLRSRLDRETFLPVEDAIRIARNVADALDYAHTRGLVHRDVKPENILFSGGHALVADFGIAKAIETAGRTQLTGTGMAVGTPNYMSPEQASGSAAVDGRSDIYALACVVYEMLGGQPPFTGPTPQVVLARHLADPVPSLRTVRSALPAGIEHAIARAMAKIPADRFATAGAFVDALERPHVSEAPPRSRRVLAAGAIVAALAALGLWSFHARQAAAADTVRSLAVLPLANLSGDTGQVYMADAMTDELITGLAQVRALRVIGRTSAQHYRATTKTVPQIARELGVDALITASLTRAGDSLRVTAQLTAGRTGQVLWAQRFDGTVQQILRLQSEVTRAVTQQLRVTLTAGEAGRLAASRREVDPGAFEAYVKGRFWWNRRGEANLRRAIGFFQEALERDPAYAQAYSGLADAYVQLGYGGFLAPVEAFPKAWAAALRALELDSTQAEPHAALGFYYLYHAWDWSAADREFQTALALNPNYATAHEWYSLYLCAVGRLDEAQRQAQRAVELDPLSVPIASTAGWIAHYSGKQEEAERRLKAAIAMDSLNGITHLYLGRVYQAQGKLDAAVAEYQRLETTRSWVPTMAGMGYIEAIAGRRADAERVLAQLDSISHTRYVTAYGIALIHAALGNKDRAFAALSRGVEERTHWLVWLNRDLRWAPLRSDPRFAALLRRVGLPS